ncbi:MAG TPA: ATP-binding protein [Burkholderiaceae bacterium]|nr:ATP-binding protein [Burkholderiaceae bacterium]
MSPAGTAAPSAVFIAVNGESCQGGVVPSNGQTREPRRDARRLRDVAFEDVCSGWCFMLAAVMLPLLAQAFDGMSEPITRVWLFVAAASAAGFALTARRALPGELASRRGTGRARRMLLGQGAGCLLLLCLHPWLVEVPPAHPPVAGPLFALAAQVLAMLLAPLGRASAVVALLPASEGLSSLAAAGHADGQWQSASYFAAALGTAVSALWLHRRWHDRQRELRQRDECIHSLEQARDAAIRADQEKTRFLAIASHDLRQPVHALGLFAATLEKRLQGSAEEPLVRNLMRAIEGLGRSFNAMLDISRLDAGTIEPNIQHFPLRDVFRRLHMHYAGQAEGAGLGLRFSPGGKSVSSDPQLLERILGNLIQNALKYTERGGVVVVARSTSTHTHVEVWDTGIGIRESDLPRIFEEFCQVGPGQRSRLQGLGIGLAIVKRLAQLLGCRLTVASRPGRGTMFRLGIPLGGLAEIEDATAAADTLPMRVLQPRSVLVIDDEEPIRDGLRSLLKEWGYCAVTAASAADAVRALETLEAPPDLILSDLHLGEGPDGIAAIASARRRCGYEVPAILVTGDITHDEMRRATHSGHMLLFKPLEPRKLFDALRGMTS